MAPQARFSRSTQQLEKRCALEMDLPVGNQAPPGEVTGVGIWTFQVFSPEFPENLAQHGLVPQPVFRRQARGHAGLGRDSFRVESLQVFAGEFQHCPGLDLGLGARGGGVFEKIDQKPAGIDDVDSTDPDRGTPALIYRQFVPGSDLADFPEQRSSEFAVIGRQGWQIDGAGHPGIIFAGGTGRWPESESTEALRTQRRRTERPRLRRGPTNANHCTNGACCAG